MSYFCETMFITEYELHKDNVQTISGIQALEYLLNELSPSSLDLLLLFFDHLELDSKSIYFHSLALLIKVLISFLL